MRTVSNLRILIVEDDRELCRSVARHLTRFGHRVDTVHTLNEARAVEAVYDCAVLDLELPDGLSIDLAEDLLDGGTTASVVFFSSVTDTKIAQRALRLGAFVTKSSGVHELSVTIADAVSRAASEMVAGGMALGLSSRRRQKSGARRKIRNS